MSDQIYGRPMHSDHSKRTNALKRQVIRLTVVGVVSLFAYGMLDQIFVHTTGELLKRWLVVEGKDVNVSDMEKLISKYGEMFVKIDDFIGAGLLREGSEPLFFGEPYTFEDMPVLREKTYAVRRVGLGAAPFRRRANRIASSATTIIYQSKTVI